MRHNDFLTVRDPLYGELRLPRLLEPFLYSPEFTRLGRVRLLNCDSLELAGVSEARRRSHTLGVLHLATRLSLLEFGPEDVAALLCAIVMHDVGTPPFGHTMEYEFIRLYSMDHEAFVTRILDGTHHKLQHAHQIGGSEIALHRAVQRSGLEERIRSILSGDHALSAVLASDIDVDNIDNVFRMAWYLGIHSDPGDAEALASAIHVDRHGTKLLDRAQQPLVEEWARLRACAYGILFNSVRHRRSQAVLSSIIAAALGTSGQGSDQPSDKGLPLLDNDDWLLTDEDLMTRLRAAPQLKKRFEDLDRPAELPELLLEFDTIERLDRSSLMRQRDLVAELLAPLHDPIYVTLVPYGEALERRVTFTDPRSGAEWSVGAPERIYRLHVHVGGAGASRRDGVSLKAQVLGKLYGHAEGEGWNVRSRAEAGAA